MPEPVVVLTGATSGIGLAAARLFAPDAGSLILCGRQPAENVVVMLDKLRQLKPSLDVHYLRADFSDLSQVEQLARDILGRTPGIDLLINNAGRHGPARRILTSDGNEVTAQVNYLAPVMLTTMLLHAIGISHPGRIVNVASTTHYSANLDPDDINLNDRQYDAYDAYAHSKLAMVTWSCWLATNRQNARLEVVSMHPGVIATKILHAMIAGGGGDSPEAGAGHVHYVATRHGDNGAYYDKRRRAAPNAEATDPTMQKRLHATTAALLHEPSPLDSA